ncbi:hypothetical protein OVY01_22275 [Robbsia sp. Bb-Pol-6]|uniref:Uncharacterized protein n=1 Tax=Robbsia betulipollinis TaxID=2981849 RepID=A0ABT3ZTG7_9BURK|nr:DUF6880 family protein [Robbsia betulipollinis]MCY0389869.1 hypothetical protein [Robbsia betulipollinis]
MHKVTRLAIPPDRRDKVLADTAELHPDIGRRLHFAEVVHANADIFDAATTWLDTLLDQTTFLTSRDIAETAVELDALRLAIVDDVANVHPGEAADLLWRFFTLAETIFNRTSEEGYEISRVFDQACVDCVTLAIRAKTLPNTFAHHIRTALAADGYGEFGNLMPSLDAPRPGNSAYVAAVKAHLSPS